MVFEPLELCYPFSQHLNHVWIVCHVYKTCFRLDTASVYPIPPIGTNYTQQFSSCVDCSLFWHCPFIVWCNRPTDKECRTWHSATIFSFKTELHVIVRSKIAMKVGLNLSRAKIFFTFCYKGGWLKKTSCFAVCW